MEAWKTGSLTDVRIPMLSRGVDASFDEPEFVNALALTDGKNGGISFPSEEARKFLVLWGNFFRPLLSCFSLDYPSASCFSLSLRGTTGGSEIRDVNDFLV